ncbi:MAG TPA: DNA polymerase IV [Smithellaceae bacterium]|nr:DNA polymerase IV [Smithellaceae bacterium]HOG82958.1 DNA polymerase IV [Smithellaceae bacterium]
MTEEPIFSLQAWPRAIAHIDGDAFFTSCEEAIHPELRGKPIITGGERGIVACASYPAKKLGVKRGVPLHEARKICPGLIILPSDYETYSLFSQRMFDIMRRFTPDVEEYSIDEAFSDITGMRLLWRASYEEIAMNMKKAIEKEMSITVSVGLSITKVLAKVASKHQKPAGMTVIKGRDIPDYLRDLPVDKIWGIGNATTNYLAKMGIRYALEFAQMPEKTVLQKFTKPGVEIWQELRGKSVYPVTAGEKSSYASISKTKTFAPPTSNAEYLFAQLMRNIESACIKARRYSLAPSKIVVFLKKNDFNTVGREVKLSRPCASPLEFSGTIHDLFDACYCPKDVYRATGVILLDLEADTNIQYTLFDNPVQAEKIKDLYHVADELGQKFGKHTVHLGSSHLIDKLGKGRRGTPTIREQTQMLGETNRRHLGLPLLHVKV